MKYGRNLFATEEEKGKTGYIYGDIEREQRFLLGADQYLRYAPLARKILRYYGKDAYNPETVDFSTEWWLRQYVHQIIETKVRNKLQYDWEYLDNSFRQLVGQLLKIDIVYDADRLEYMIPEARIPDPIEQAS